MEEKKIDVANDSPEELEVDDLEQATGGKTETVKQEQEPKRYLPRIN